MTSTANATNTEANAVDNSEVTIAGNHTLNAGTPVTGTNTVDADASNTNGPADATADSGESAAVIDSLIDGEGNATVNAREHLSVTADAQTTTGRADATASNDTEEDRTGGLINSDQEVGGDYNQSVDVDNSTIAGAATTTGDATAEAGEYSSFGILDSNIDVEGDYVSTVDNDNTISASASTFTGEAEADSTSEERTGIRFGGPEGEDSGDVLDVEGNAELAVTVGTADDPNTMSASANVVGDGDANAFVGATSNYGITGSGGEVPPGPLPLDGNPGQSSDGDEGSGFGAIIRLTEQATLDSPFEITGLRISENLSSFVPLQSGETYTVAFYSETNTQISTDSVDATPFDSSSSTLLGEVTGTVNAEGEIEVSASDLPASPVGSIGVFGTQGVGGSQFNTTGVGVTNGSGGEISLAGATILVSGNADITAEVDNVYGAAASSTTGDSTAITNTSGGLDGAIGSGETIGIDAAVIDVDGNAANIEGTVNNESSSTADTTTGDATATDVSGLQAGIRATTLDVAGASIITGRVSNDQMAMASSVSADEGDGAQASVQAGEDDEGFDADIIGLDAETMNLGGDATITGSAEISQVAGADLTTGDAEAEGTVAGDVSGVENGERTTANGDLTVGANASVDIESSASNTSGADEWAVSAESTLEGNVDLIGLNQDGALTVGGDYTVNADANAELDATANSTDDNADAESKAEDGSDIFGAEFDGEEVSIKGDATINANANADFSGTATTTSGSAYADAKVDDLGGLRIDDIGGSDAFEVAGDATLVGNAGLDLEASATSTSGDANTDAVATGDVRGIEITERSQGVEVGGNAWIVGNVAADLTATSTTVGDDDEGSDSEADARLQDGAQGVYSDDEQIDIEGNLFLAGNVTANVSADASNTNGNADAEADADDTIAGIEMREDAPVEVAGNAVILSSVDATFDASAASTTGEADAYADVEDPVESASFAEDVEVEGDATIVGDIDLVGTASATTTTGDSEADADVEEIEGLVFDGDLDTGGDATLTSEVDATLLASAVSTSGDANADVDGDDNIRAIEADDVEVGGNFTATGTLNLDGTAYAETVNPDDEGDGQSEADVEFDDSIQAVELDDTDVEGNADVTGTADVDLTATAISVNTDAEADTKHYEDELEGVDIDEGLDAEGNVSVTGRAELSAAATAFTTDGDADAEADSEGLNGIDYENIEGADVVLDGDALLEQTASATTTDGDADAKIEQDNEVAGIRQRSGDDDEGFATEAAGSLTAEGDAASIGAASATTVDGNAEAEFEADDDVVGAEFNETLKSFGDMDVTGNALLDASTTATSVSGDADADVDADGAEGIEFDASVYADGDANFDGNAEVLTSAVASSTGDDEGSDEANAYSDVEEVVGLDADDNDDLIDVDGDLTASGSALAMQNADASIVTGDATAEINADISESEVTGAAFSTDDGEGLDVLGDATVTGSATVNNNASASSTTGDATAFEKVSATTGVIDDLVVGGDATVEATAELTGSASASTVDGDARAQSGDAAILDGESNVIGYAADGSIDVGGDADVTGLASTNNSADAVSVDGDASALSGHDDVIGIRANGEVPYLEAVLEETIGDGDGNSFDTLFDSVEIDGNANFDAEASAVSTSSAATTSGDSEAFTGTDRVIGLDLNRMVEDSIEGEVGSLIAEVAPAALENEGEGPIGPGFGPISDMPGPGMVSDVMDDEGLGSEIPEEILDPAFGNTVVIKGDTTIDADAFFDGTASASANTGNSIAAVDATSVHGVESVYENVNVGGDADVSASAVSIQNASASTTTAEELDEGNNPFAIEGAIAITGAVTPDLNGPTGGFLAPFFEGDHVIGSEDTDYFIAGDATQFDTRAEFDATSEANAVTGDAEAIAGTLSSTIGFESDFIGEVNIAGNATGELGVLSYASSNLTTEAQTTSGDASASSEAVVVKGAENMNLDVGGNVEGEWGARAVAVGNFSASAESVDGELTDAVISADGRGFDSSFFGIEQFEQIIPVPGLDDAPGFSDIDISGNGNVTQYAQLVGNAEAVTVGDSVDDVVEASVNLDAIGGDFNGSLGDITVMGSGNVRAEGSNEGSATALGVTSGANAYANVNSEGFKLDDSSITIGGAGDVAGNGFIGEWQPLGNSYVNTDAFSVSAETTTGNAVANGGDDAAAMFTAIGIGGGEDAVVTAGPSGGDITGIASAAADLSATTTNGNADSESEAALFGIQDVTLQGGRDGESTIDGRALGIFNTSSNSVNGNANATSDVTGVGMDGFSFGEDAMVNGNINAVADISNTVMASTVTGSANANATGSAVGVQGYNIVMEGNGVITANASTNIVAVASTVTSEDI